MSQHCTTNRGHLKEERQEAISLLTKAAIRKPIRDKGKGGPADLEDVLLAVDDRQGAVRVPSANVTSTHPPVVERLGSRLEKQAWNRLMVSAPSTRRDAHGQRRSGNETSQGRIRVDCECPLIEASRAHVWLHHRRSAVFE